MSSHPRPARPSGSGAPNPENGTQNAPVAQPKPEMEQNGAPLGTEMEQNGAPLGTELADPADIDGFYTHYARARDIGLDCLADRALEIAETPLVAERRVQKADGGVEITTLDAVDRSRLTVETLKWYLCKLAPKKYGDKVSTELTGSDGGPIQTENTIVEYIRPKDKNS